MLNPDLVKNLQSQKKMSPQAHIEHLMKSWGYFSTKEQEDDWANKFAQSLESIQNNKSTPQEKINTAIEFLDKKGYRYVPLSVNSAGGGMIGTAVIPAHAVRKNSAQGGRLDMSELFKGGNTGINGGAALTKPFKPATKTDESFFEKNKTMIFVGVAVVVVSGAALWYFKFKK